MQIKTKKTHVENKGMHWSNKMHTSVFKDTVVCKTIGLKACAMQYVFKEVNVKKLRKD